MAKKTQTEGIAIPLVLASNLVKTAPAAMAAPQVEKKTSKKAKAPKAPKAKPEPKEKAPAPKFYIQYQPDGRGFEYVCSHEQPGSQEGVDLYGPFDSFLESKAALISVLKKEMEEIKKVIKAADDVRLKDIKVPKH